MDPVSSNLGPSCQESYTLPLSHPIPLQGQITNENSFHSTMPVYRRRTSIENKQPAAEYPHEVLLFEIT